MDEKLSSSEISLGTGASHYINTRLNLHSRTSVYIIQKGCHIRKRENIKRLDFHRKAAILSVCLSVSVSVSRITRIRILGRVLWCSRSEWILSDVWCSLLFFNLHPLHSLPPSPLFPPSLPHSIPCYLCRVSVLTLILMAVLRLRHFSRGWEGENVRPFLLGDVKLARSHSPCKI